MTIKFPKDLKERIRKRMPKLDDSGIEFVEREVRRITGMNIDEIAERVANKLHERQVGQFPSIDDIRNIIRQESATKDDIKELRRWADIVSRDDPDRSGS